MMSCGFLLTSFLFSFVISLPKQEAGLAKSIVGQKANKLESKSEEKRDELVQMLEKDVLQRVVDDDTGKILPDEIIPNVVVPHLPPKDKNFARKMSEARWQQQHSRLHPKPFLEYKRVMHNRNTINDNRHDRKAKKLARHLH